ncbi:hypothetical protein HUW46_05246 [Amycolatopsis sp. CA-230715]|nr:hypothetical protein HUW46_05246 [Amycolatopsis sp. CA-230715]
MCRISKAAAEKRAALAVALTSYLPCTLRALESGLIDEYGASRVFSATECLSEELAREVDSLLVGRFDVRDASALRRVVNRIMLQVDPEGYERRRKEKESLRVLEIRHGDHGSSTLFAQLPTDRAQAIYAACDREARRLKQQGDQRTMDQLRADALAQRCLQGPGTGSPRAEIFVYVDLPTLLRLQDNTAELAGYGDISAELAREIAFSSNSTWRRIVRDPITGLPCDMGRASYRAPKPVALYTQVRHRTCCMPGCNRPAQFTDLDHATAWADGGRTDKVNLRPLCRIHHLLKDEPGWKFDTDDEDGTLIVTTPASRSSPRNQRHPGCLGREILTLRAVPAPRANGACGASWRPRNRPRGPRTPPGSRR